MALQHTSVSLSAGTHFLKFWSCTLICRSCHGIFLWLPVGADGWQGHLNSGFWQRDWTVFSCRVGFRPGVGSCDPLRRCGGPGGLFLDRNHPVVISRSLTWLFGFLPRQAVVCRRLRRLFYTLVTRGQPYLFATIFKHFIYVCFQLLIFMNENQLKLH